MFVINNQAFGYGNLDEVGGDKAEGEEEDGVEDAHGEVEEVLVLLRHVAFVQVEELETVGEIMFLSTDLTLDLRL